MAFINHSEDIAALCKKISESSQNLEDGAAQQAASIEETSSAIEEISSMVSQNADNAKEAASLANLFNTSAEQSDHAMCMLNTAINEIIGSSKQIAHIINTFWIYTILL